MSFEIQKLLSVQGYAVIPEVLQAGEMEALKECFRDDTPGQRSGLHFSAVARLADRLRCTEWLRAAVGEDAFALRATLFDKSPDHNWQVTTHQDMTIPVKTRIEAAGFDGWSTKAGVIHVRPPTQILEHMLAVRVDLDGSDVENGALAVIPGSHGRGRLEPKEIAELRNDVGAVICPVPASGALIMRPLLLHASSKSQQPLRRRIVHIEFASGDLPAGLSWARIGPVTP